jgi:hypothetical protein
LKDVEGEEVENVSDGRAGGGYAANDGEELNVVVMEWSME